jgi:hypothetical protein
MTEPSLVVVIDDMRAAAPTANSYGTATTGREAVAATKPVASNVIDVIVPSCPTIEKGTRANSVCCAFSVGAGRSQTPERQAPRPRSKQVQYLFVAEPPTTPGPPFRTPRHRCQSHHRPARPANYCYPGCAEWYGTGCQGGVDDVPDPDHDLGLV